MDPICTSNTDWIYIGRHLAISYASKEFKMNLQCKNGDEVHIAQGNRRAATSAANCSQRNRKFSVYSHCLMATNWKLNVQKYPVKLKLPHGPQTSDCK